MNGMGDLDRVVAAALRAAAPASSAPHLLRPSDAFLGRPLAAILGLQKVAERRHMPLVGVYLTASEYLGPFFIANGEEYRPDPIWTDLVLQHPRSDLLCALALLNHAARDTDLAAQLRTYFIERAPAIGTFLDDALNKTGDDRRVFLARGPILRTVRAVLNAATDDSTRLADARRRLGLPPAGTMDLTIVAILLTHLVADTMGRKAVDGEPRVGGLPQSLAMEMIQNTLFHQVGDVGDLLARTRLLWQGMDLAALQPQPRDLPVRMVEQATGAKYDPLVATAFALWARAQAYSPDEPMLLDPQRLPAEIQPYLGSTLPVLTATADELAAAARGQAADWQMLPLQEHPVVALSNGLLVLDETYLMDRVATGLFWLVHDYEKATYGDAAAHTWRGNHGDLFEQLAERRIRRLAPPSLGSAPTFFTEADLRDAYPGPGKKHCDAGIDYGSTVVLAEVVSGQVSVSTRTLGEPQALQNDLERLVFKKTRQLHDTALRLLDASHKGTAQLLGRGAPRIHPVIVQGGQFPHSEVTRRLIDGQLSEERLLQDARIAPLSIVGLDDLELVELLRQRDGVSFPELLDGWRNSIYANTGLRNYLIETFRLHGGVKRTAEIQAELDPQLETITRLLGTDMPERGEDSQ
jgi:hypothetical protein